MRLTDAEVNLYQHHLKMLDTGPLRNPDGSISTIQAITVGSDEGTHVIPTIYEGEKVSNDEAVRRAMESKKFPFYKSLKEAQDRYDQMHQYMDRDVQDYLR